MKNITRAVFLLAWAAWFGALYGQTVITGSVKDAAGRPLNGVFVSAAREGANHTVTVFSDDTGKFRIQNLPAGKYTVSANAGGFRQSRQAEVLKPRQVTDINFSLEPEARAQELLDQATGGEWLVSVPGTDRQKLSLSQNCSGCHGLYHLMTRRFSRADWLKIVDTMKILTAIGEVRDEKPSRWRGATDEEITDYLGQIQGPDSPLPAIRFSPRPTGKATEGVYTEYRIPRSDAIPHDVNLDAEGNLWYNDWAANYIGKLNPKTGQFKEYKMPDLAGAHPGALGIVVDRNQIVWVAQLWAGRVVRFDPKTEKVTGIWKTPIEPSRPGILSVDPRGGTVWLGDGIRNSAWRLDVASGNFKEYEVGGYGLEVNSKGMVYRGGFSDDKLKMLNPETGKVSYYPTPHEDSAPRRGDVDWEDNFWFGEWLGGKIGKLDFKTGLITDYPVSVAFAAFYDAGVDRKNRLVWAQDYHNDRMVRVNPANGEVVEYPMPTLDAEVRRTVIDSSTNPPSVWTINMRHGLIVRLQAP